jgi:hypothetical protein
METTVGVSSIITVIVHNIGRGVVWIRRTQFMRSDTYFHVLLASLLLLSLICTRHKSDGLGSLCLDG